MYPSIDNPDAKAQELSNCSFSPQRKKGSVLSLAELQGLCPQVTSILDDVDEPVVACSYTPLVHNSQLLKPRQSASISAWAIGLGDQSYTSIRIYKAGGWLSPATILASVKKGFPIGHVVVITRCFKGIIVNVYHAQGVDMRDTLFKAFADQVMDR